MTNVCVSFPGRSCQSVKVMLRATSPKLHSKFSQDFLAGSNLRTEKVKGLKRQQSLFTKLTKNAKAATETLFSGAGSGTTTVARAAASRRVARSSFIPHILLFALHKNSPLFAPGMQVLSVEFK